MVALFLSTNMQVLNKYIFFKLFEIEGVKQTLN